MLMVVLRYYPTLSETFVVRELAGLHAAGVPVVVAALGQRADGVHVRDLPDVPVLRPPRGLATVQALPAIGQVSLVLRARQGAKAALRGAWLAQQARRLGVTHLHAHFVGEAAEVAQAIGHALQVPWSVTAHAVDLFKPRPSAGDLLRDARPAFTVCEHHVRWIRAHHGVDARLLPLGVPTDTPQADPSSEGPLRLITVARDVPKKGLDLLLHALDDLPEARLRLVSDSPRRHPRAEVGPLPPHEVPAALSQAHAFVLPCRRAPDGDLDGLPVAVLEAMSAGLPVITTEVAGLPEIVDDEVGWLLPPDDPPALVQALRHAARDPQARAHRGRAARQRLLARGHTVPAQVDALRRGILAGVPAID